MPPRSNISTCYHCGRRWMTDVRTSSPVCPECAAKGHSAVYFGCPTCQREDEERREQIAAKLRERRRDDD